MQLLLLPSGGRALIAPSQVISIGSAYAFSQTQQNVIVFDALTVLTERLDLEFAVGLENPHAGAVHDGALRRTAIERLPRDPGVGIGIPDGQEYRVLLVVINQCLRRRAAANGSRRSEEHT